MKDGIINLIKPVGMTSNDAIYKMRAILGIKKLGHTGTLDPLAGGVLPICINRATRVAEYMDVDFKVYRAVMILGVTTDTEDVTGEVLETADKSAVMALTDENIRAAFTDFHGLIEQYPPMYSAIKINGRKLYDIMHEGNADEAEIAKKKIKSRQVYIADLNVDEILRTDDSVRVAFTVTCSKGTYIRTICKDAGENLGVGAAMESLERLASGAFTVDNAVTLDELREVAKANGILNSEGFSVDKSYHEDIPACFEKYVFPCDYPLTHFGKAVVSAETAKRFIDGWHIAYGECISLEKPSYEAPVDKSRLRDAKQDADSNHHGSYPGLKVHPEYAEAYKIYREDGEFIGVAFHSDTYHKLVADKVFFRTEKNDANIF